jgi:nascent polypeptide-associated complex subunit beta
MAKKDKNTKKVNSKHKFEVNHEKLALLKKNSELVRTGGKGTARRKIKKVTKSANEDPKVKNTLKKLNVRPLPDIDDVKFYMEDQSVLEFKNPRVQIQQQTSTLVVQGKFVKKTMDEVAPDLMKQMGMTESDFASLQQQTETEEKKTEGDKKDDDLPELESFD